MRTILLSLLVCSILCSCQPTLLTLYGIHPGYKPTMAKTKRYARRLGIDTAQSFYVDTAYTNYIAKQFAGQKQFYHDMYQPLGAFYYRAADGKPETAMVNCYAGGFIKLKWNRDNALEKSFPPQQLMPLDSLQQWNLNSHLQQIKALYDIPPPSAGNAEYVVFIHWSHYMGRHNKYFLRQYRKNLKKAPAGSVKVFYVNTDILLDEMDKE